MKQRLVRGVLVASCLLSLSACRRSPAPGSAPDPDPDRASLARAEAAATQLVRELRGRLMSALQDGGPPAAVQVCAGLAQTIGAHIRGQTGVQVGRASLRMRNPADAAPDWVSTWLSLQGERSANGVQGFARIDTVDGRRVARVLRPIAIEPPCLTCHGPREGLAPAVQQVLASQYPNDRATGYNLGDLRGALWAQVDVAR